MCNGDRSIWAETIAREGRRGLHQSPGERPSYNRGSLRVATEVVMSIRASMVSLALLSLVFPTFAKDKKKQALPDMVLNAHRVLVVIYPDAGEPLTDLNANQNARDSVERALMKWGRFELAMEPQTADLVIAVRKGHSGGPTITNSPTDDRPVIYQPSGADTRVGGQHGRPPDVTNPFPGGMENRGPRITNEIGSSEDAFDVFLGGMEYPLDSAPVWHYRGKDALKGSQLAAVEQFHKAIEESEKAREEREKKK